MRAPVVLVALALGLAGCASGGAGSPESALTGAGGAGASASSVLGPTPAGTSAPQPQPAGASGLVVLHDPGQVTGTLTGPCHTGGGGQLPDPRCTPGGIDPAVTQADIHSTICTSGYTSTIRPPEAQTEAFKFGEAYPAYGIASGTATELDHLVPLELGGDNSSANLWPEVPPSPNPKDSVENALNAAVCAGRVTLASAQQAIAQDWQTAETRLGLSTAAAAPAPAPAPAKAGTSSGMSCSASVSTSSPADYSTVDVTVRTAAGATVTTVAHYKTTSHQLTAVADASGVATVGYYISGAAPGFTVVVDVSAAAGSRSASCSTAFTPTG
ncbi:MAG TPA: hypothetical protein VH520_08525 [Streptosporangiaceae bacterium]